jgi:hypothetical protein
MLFRMRCARSVAPAPIARKRMPRHVCGMNWSVIQYAMRGKVYVW